MLCIKDRLGKTINRCKEKPTITRQNGKYYLSGEFESIFPALEEKQFIRGLFGGFTSQDELLSSYKVVDKSGNEVQPKPGASTLEKEMEDVRMGQHETNMLLMQLLNGGAE